MLKGLHPLRLCCVHHFMRGREVELTNTGFHLMMSSAEIRWSPVKFASYLGCLRAEVVEELKEWKEFPHRRPS